LFVERRVNVILWIGHIGDNIESDIHHGSAFANVSNKKVYCQLDHIGEKLEHIGFFTYSQKNPLASKAQNAL